MGATTNPLRTDLCGCALTIVDGRLVLPVGSGRVVPIQVDILAEFAELAGQSISRPSSAP